MRTTQALSTSGPKFSHPCPLPRTHETRPAFARRACHFACTAHKAMNPTCSSSVLPWACWCYIFFWLFYNTGELWGKESISVDIIHPAFLCPAFSVLTLFSWNRKQWRQEGYLSPLWPTPFRSALITEGWDLNFRPSLSAEAVSNESEYSGSEFYLQEKSGDCSDVPPAPSRVCWEHGCNFKCAGNSKDNWSKFRLPLSESHLNRSQDQMCLARGHSGKGSCLTEAPSAKHFLNIYNVPDLRLGSGIHRGMNAFSLECPSPLPLLPLDVSTHPNSAYSSWPSSDARAHTTPLCSLFSE